jgi:hypothetical protein
MKRPGGRDVVSPLPFGGLALALLFPPSIQPSALDSVIVLFNSVLYAALDSVLSFIIIPSC